MYLSIVFLPLLSAFIGGFFGRILGSKGTSILTTSFIIITALLSATAFYQIALLGNTTYIELFSWIDSEMFTVSWGFQFDTLTAVMLVVVTSISALVHLYSISYMENDPHRPRFMTYLSLFTFFMLMLVTGDNFIQLFLGWEGVGLSSYLLINFWFTRLQANKAAVKAMIVNRVGDFGLGLGILGIFYAFKAVDFSTVFALAPYVASKTFIFFNYELNLLNIICILLFIGAVGKSAQIGLHTWLPDAMEGPTPVSALIHAATMVTAGVFLIARCSPLFEYAPLALVIVTIFGALTAFFAATTGLTQNDLKRVIAYSTCSQLGYMVFACGISNYSIGMFHLANHAFFKALLFLSAGSVIHALSDEQDMRRMGGLIQIIPFTYAMMLIGSLSLMGFPFLTGFYSKDAILEMAYAKYTISGTFSHWLGTISAFFTSFYSIRLLYLAFINKTNSLRIFIEHAHDAPVIMAIPLILLSFGSIFIGYIWKDMMIGLGTSFWGNSLFVLPQNITIIEAEFIPTLIKLIPVIFSISGAITAIIAYHFFSGILLNFQMSPIGREIYIFSNKKWFFDKIYNELIVQKILQFAYTTTYKTFDKGFIELLGPYGISQTIVRLSKKLSKLQDGYIYHYAFLMLLGVITAILYLLTQEFVTQYFILNSKIYLTLIFTGIFYLFFINDKQKE